MRCPSDPIPVDLLAGFRNIGLPPLCKTSPPSRYLSYQFNYALIEYGIAHQRPDGTWYAANP